MWNVANSRACLEMSLNRSENYMAMCVQYVYANVVWEKKAFATQFHGQTEHKMHFRPRRNLGASAKKRGLPEISVESGIAMGKPSLRILSSHDWKNL